MEKLNNVRMDFWQSQINNKKDNSGFIKFGPGGMMFFDEFCSLYAIRQKHYQHCCSHFRLKRLWKIADSWCLPSVDFPRDLGVFSTISPPYVIVEHLFPNSWTVLILLSALFNLYLVR